jgi:hypothetical protein
VVIELTRKASYALEPHAAGLRVVFGGPKASAAPPAPATPPSSAPAPPKASAAAPQFKLQGIVLQTPRGTTEMRLEEPQRSR